MAEAPKAGFVERAEGVMRGLWAKVEKADDGALTEEELYKHLCLCAKGSAGGEWSGSGFTNMDDLFGMEEAEIAVKCKEAYEAMGGTESSQVTFDGALAKLILGVGAQVGGDLSTFDEQHEEDSEGWTCAGDQYVMLLARVAEKFEGKKPETGAERLEWLQAFARRVFDAIDLDKDGFLEKAELQEALIGAMMSSLPPSMQASMREEMKEQSVEMLDYCYACADENRDDKLSFEEAYQGFLQSGFIGDDDGSSEEGPKGAVLGALDAMDMAEWLDSVESRFKELSKHLFR